MQKAFYFLHRRPGMTRENYINYYETIHRPLITANLPRQSDFRRHFPVWPLSAQTMRAQAGFDSLTAITYETREGFTDAYKKYSSLPFNAIVVEDETRFLDRGRMCFMPVIEVIEPNSKDDAWHPAPICPTAKLLRFVWRPDETSPDEFRERDRSGVRAAKTLLEGCLDVRRNYLLPADPFGHCTENLSAIDRLRDYRCCDVVEEYSFAAEGDARAALTKLADPTFGRGDEPPVLQVETVACDHFVSVYEDS